jgi:cytochrome c oxidase assembly factor CtaG
MLASSLVLVGAVYALGVARLWRHAGVGRGVRVRQASAFGAGWLAMVIALSSPMDEWSERWLAAHMIQHELLMIVAAPLMAAAAPLVALLWAMPARTRQHVAQSVRRRPIVRAWAVLTAPATGFILYAAALWIWHLPALYDRALEHEGLHVVQHLCFFGTAALFWWGIAHGRYGRAGYGAAVVYIFATAAHGGVLGALLTIAPRVWYPPYLANHTANLTPLEDQQLAGLLMWVPAGLSFVAGALYFFAAWLRQSDRRSRFPSRPALTTTRTR